MSKKVSVRLPVSNLKPGFIASRDIYTRNGQLLLSKDAIIDENVIARIMFFGIMSVHVYKDEEEEKAPTYEQIDAEMPIQHRYLKVVDTLTHTMNQLLEKNGDIDVNSLASEVDHIVSSAKSSYAVFDLLQSMRSYDDETYTHCLNVGMLCNVFSDWLGMSEYEKKIATLCGLLHDFGKLLIPQEVLRKPGKLTSQEFDIIKSHPVKGYEFLKNKPIHESIKKAVLLHHERCDGKGYPLGLNAREIDSYAELTGFADVFEAMTANRVYRQAICPFEVIRIVQEEGNSQFNPMIFIPILQNIADTYSQREVLLSGGIMGKVVVTNRKELSRPMVLCDGKIIDLAKNRQLIIIQVF